MKIEVCYPDIRAPYSFRGLQMPRVGVRESRFCVFGSKEVYRMHGAVFIDYLREVPFECRLRSVWSGDLDSLSECLQALLLPEH